MTETAQTVKDIVSEIAPYLSQLADKLQTTSGYLWQMQVKQAYVTLATDITLHLIWLAIVIVWATIGVRFVNKKFDDEELIAVCWLMSAIAFSLIFASLPSFKEMFTIIINPEYWALKELLIMTKSVAK